jgi:hypothetical protein
MLKVITLAVVLMYATGWTSAEAAELKAGGHPIFLPGSTENHSLASFKGKQVVVWPGIPRPYRW